MSTTPSAAASGQFKIGDITVNRLGFGAMRITGKGVWGDPQDPEEAKRVLKRLPELDVNLIDTADSYGPFVSEDLIHEVLSPYKDMLIATKGGFARLGPAIWEQLGRPEYLKQCVLMSMRRLGVDHIDLWQLHRIDPKLPAEEQFEAIAEMQTEGLIRYVGLSQVSVDEIKLAQKYFPVVTVQNRFNLVDRSSEDVLDFCEKEGIGFIPFFPLAAGDLAKPGSVLDGIAKKLDASPGQVALAWTLKRSPVMLPIPGTSKVKHLEENVAAGSLELTDEDFAALDEQGKEAEAA
ncbi:aldo/keto reductase [Methyloligella solikamskensis]|uniref:Aldo/keto reductase n=1 Tax=Methyloligella solikamskensis TaxID=1177756 RepID=A0ABW3J5X4_9HYPH